MVFGEFFRGIVLPFLLVFVVVFAILQKSKILGDGKAQIDSMAALVIALISVTIPAARNIIVNIFPWFAVGVAVILVFLILYGFVAGDLSSAAGWMKATFGILAGVFTIGIVVYVTGLWDIIINSTGGSWESWVANIFMILLVVGAFIVAARSGKTPREP